MRLIIGFCDSTGSKGGDADYGGSSMSFVASISATTVCYLV